MNKRSRLPHRIDGASGEGGGQIIRSALTLAAVTGEPVAIEAVRGRRRSPGLKAQHLTAARAAAAICGGRLEGDVVGSGSLAIEPDALRGGVYAFDVGTAGSVMLVLQTLLPALVTADEPSSIELRGGTHNPLAPTWEFVADAYLPMLRRMGAGVSAQLSRRGFFPRGGGLVSVQIQPQPLRPLLAVDRGGVRSRRACAVCGRLPKHVGEREMKAFADQVGSTGWDTQVIVDDATLSAGNVAAASLEFEHCSDVVTEHGRVGLAAESVGKRLARRAKAVLDGTAPIGEQLADQLLTPLAIIAWQGAAAPSRFRTGPLSLHSLTLIPLLRQVLGVRIGLEPLENEQTLVTMGE